MQTHWVFNGCADWTKQQLTAYWAKKARRLERLLVHFPSPLTDLRLTVYAHREPPRYECRAALIDVVVRRRGRGAVREREGGRAVLGGRGRGGRSAPP